MTPVANDATNQHLHANASREVMHGLFKDMGKQAMALEAILRVVCGKVDRMETWMTTISFGMSELDLKLRNIAHNIDGTSAVDDDGGGKQPWTVPPPDDDIAGDRFVATVSKKIGKNSKQVRVTGMAAAIIDKLAAEPKSAVDKANKKKRVSAIPAVETPKKAVKKKKPPSQHQHQSAPAEAEVAHTIDGSSENGVMKATDTFGAVNSPFISQAVAEAGEPSIALHDEKPLQAIKIVTQGEVLQPVEFDSVALTEREVMDSALESERSTSHSSPRDMHMHDPVGSSGASSTDSTPVHSSRAQDHLESTNDEQTSSDQEQTQDKPLSSAEATEELLRVVITPAEEETVRSARTVASPELMESPAPTLERLTPITTSQSDDPLMLPDTAQESVVVERVEDQHPSSVGEAPPSPSNAAKASAVPAPAISAEVTQVSKNEVDKPRRSSLIGRVLEMNERSQNHRRRSSEKIPPPGDQTPQTPSNNPPAKHYEVKQAPQLEIPPLIHSALSAEQLDDSDALKSTRSSVEDDKFDGDGGSESSQDDDDNSSESSSSGSDGAEGSPEHQQSDTKGTSASRAAAAMITGKRTSLVAGSTISRTMTALKKLKKANMLTPEEEEELKQRAQEKWYKLKGHVKEKQKKEVANILLKRKKNVFTVSSRLELLEEKSKELFAAIKQIGNDLKIKTDLTAHEALRRQVADMQRSLQNMDVRLGKMASQLTPERVAALGKQLDALRAGISEELGSLHQVVNSNYSQLDAQIIEQRDRLQSIEEEIPEKLVKQAQEFEQKLHALPDFGSSIEALRRALRRKADLKMLKELEARLLGHTLEEEDCLVRCLSCHKEVVNLQQLDKDGEDEDAGSGTSISANQLRKVNPGPSSAKIYRSNVPFSAEPTGMSSDVTLNADSNLPSTPTFSESKSTASMSRRADTGLPKASPISRLAVTSTSSPLSPDRPISAPAAALKKKMITTIKARTANSIKAFQDAKE